MTQNALPTRIWMVCHPATRKQLEGFFPFDEPLDSHALAGVADIVWRPQGSVRVYTSPELRTIETATALGLTAEVATELRECNFGTWSGRSLEEAYSEDPSGLSSWLSDLTAAPHHGESFDQLLTRVSNWLDGQHQTGPCLVLTHASVIRASIVHALGAPPEAFRRIEIAPLSLTDLRLNGLQWHIRSTGVPLRSDRATS